MPHHGVFVWERLRAYLARHGGEAVVLAPVPYVPAALAKGSYALFREVPREECREGVRILHPRYPLIPKLSMSVAPLSLYAVSRLWIKKLLKQGHQFDLLDAHYLYPDAVAAGLLAREFRWPLVVTARGTDVNLIPRYRVPRMWLQWLLKRVQGTIAVSAALREIMAPLLAPDQEVRVLRNGVDLEKFRPLPQAAARQELGWDHEGPLVLSVGHLIERKGHHHLLEGLAELSRASPEPAHPPQWRAKIVGVGPWLDSLRTRARTLGIDDRVQFVGALPHERLRLAYAAADVLALLSSREGWPNVLLEAMACGTPVLATEVYGAPEIVRSTAVGALLREPSAEAVAAALQELLSHPRDSQAVREHAEQHSWGEVADGMKEVFEQAVQRRTRSKTPAS
jgi:glycosyltransferase involved in cell wall biosynthesis